MEVMSCTSYNTATSMHLYEHQTIKHTYMHTYTYTIKHAKLCQYTGAYDTYRTPAYVTRYALVLVVTDNHVNYVLMWVILRVQWVSVSPSH